MKRPRYGNAVTVLALLAGLSGPGLAGSEDVVVADAWPRATMGMNRPGAACLTLRNTGLADLEITGVAATGPVFSIAPPDDLPWVLKYSGEKSLVIGTDYGHYDPSSDADAIIEFKKREDISQEIKDKILCHNQKVLYNL